MGVRTVSLALAATLLAAVGARGQADTRYKVIVHSTNPTSALTKDRLSRLFLKKISTWEDGSRVMPVDLTDRSPVCDAFTVDVHRRPIVALKAFWQQRIFSGADVPPPELESESEVVAYVEGHPGAIGYVSGGRAVGQAKVLEILSEPVEPRK